MRILQPTLLAICLTFIIASTASAGNIGGMRTSGNIGGMRSAGNIGGTRTAGNIGGTRSAGQGPQINAPLLNTATSRLDLETFFSSSFAGLIRMMLESGGLF